MKRVWWPAAVYAAAHFAVDLGCAFAVFSFCDGGSLGFLPAYLGAESIPGIALAVVSLVSAGLLVFALRPHRAAL